MNLFIYFLSSGRVHVCAAFQTFLPSLSLYEVLWYEADLMKDLDMMNTTYLRDRSGGRRREERGSMSVSRAISRQMSLTLITTGGTKQANKTQLKATLRKQVAKTSIRLWLESCDGEKCESIVLVQDHLTTNNLIWVYTG